MIKLKAHSDRPASFLQYEFSDNSERIRRGRFSISTSKSNSTEEPILTAHLWDVLIDEEHRGRGYGKQLLKDAIRIAKQSGASRMVLTVNNSNTIAQKLYESEHFEYPHGKPTDDDASGFALVRMERLL